MQAENQDEQAGGFEPHLHCVRVRL